MSVLSVLIHPSSAAPRSRDPVLPVLHRRSGSTHSATNGTRPGGKRQAAIKARRPLRTAMLVLAALLLAAVVLASCAATLLGLYAYSILHEPRAGMEAAAALAQAAAAAAVMRADGFPAGQQEQRRQLQLAQARYTVVIMSYSKRMATLPVVVNQLARCPSTEEVLLVWNGDSPPSTQLFERPDKVRIRHEAKNDLSNRVRPDSSIRTAAVFLADDDLLLRCTDIELAFARWQANPQAVVGSYPRYVSSDPPTYDRERKVFSRMQYNAILTGAAFVSQDLMRAYWSDRFAQGRDLVKRMTNCEDLLFNFVAATIIREQHQGHHPADEQQAQQQQGLSSTQSKEGSINVMTDAGVGSSEAAKGRLSSRLPPHAIFSQPSRRLDISKLSGVGLSRNPAPHEAARRMCMVKFGEWYGMDLLQPRPLVWDEEGLAWRYLKRPICSIPITGCIYA